MTILIVDGVYHCYFGLLSAGGVLSSKFSSCPDHDMELLSPDGHVVILAAKELRCHLFRCFLLAFARRGVSVFVAHALLFRLLQACGMRSPKARAR